MHQRTHISSSTSRKAKPTFLRRLLAVAIAGHLAVNPSPAASDAQLMAIPEFVALAMSIANLNKAMRDAAENPMDTWRQQNVKHAMGMLPMAIRGLAEVFKSGKLHDADLPVVQQMLGGFVDVNAPAAYKKFLANPDKRLIPKVGNNFPVAVDQSAGSKGGEHLVFDDAIAKGGAGTADSSNKKNAIAESADLVDVSAMAAASEKTFKTEKSKAQTETIVFDDSVKKADASVGASTSNADTSVPRTPASVSGSVGSSSESSVTVVKVKPAEKSTTLDEDFFELPGKSERQKKALKRDPSTYQRKIQPKYWNLVPYLRLVDEAKAKCQGGNCSGQQGGEGGGSGASASEVLFGLAAIMAAVSPMVAAGIQAGADKDIAKTNANAQMAMTQMSADTSKHLADQQQQIAMGQAQIAADISAKNQQASTERLNMQLAELNVAREQAAKLEDKKFAYQQQLDAERVALAKAQSEEASKVAAKQMRAQLAAAGMSQGFASSTNSAAGTPINRSTTTAASGTTAATGSSANLGNAFAVTSATNAAKASMGASSRLLASVGGTTKKGATTTKKTTQSKSYKAASQSTATASVEASPALRGVMETQSLVRGSTSTVKSADASTPASDLVKFTSVASKQSESFARSLAGEPHAKTAVAPVAPVTTTKTQVASSGHSSAYNAPTDVSEKSDVRAFKGTTRSVYGGL